MFAAMIVIVVVDKVLLVHRIGCILWENKYYDSVNNMNYVDMVNMTTDSIWKNK